MNDASLYYEINYTNQRQVATIFSHAFVAVGLSSIFPSRFMSRKAVLVGMLGAILPDFDTIGYQLGVPYESLFGHRGFTHSFFFAAAASLCLLVLFFPLKRNPKSTSWLLWLYLFLAIALHPVVDALTSGGLGVAFFSPFSNARYFFPFRPVKVCHIGVSDLFNGRLFIIFRSEFLWLWVPSLLAIAASVLFRKSNQRTA